MKRLAVVLLFVVLAAPIAAAQQTLVANMTGAQEIPPGDPNGVGSATITITGTTLTYTITVNNVDAPTAQHIHPGAAGQTGAPLVNLPGVWTGSGQGPWTLTGTTTTDPATAAALLANPGNFYVNVHNAAFPAGAVRGQLAHLGGIPTASTWGLMAMAAMLAIAGLLYLGRV